MATATKRVVRRENRSKGGLTKSTVGTWFRQWVTADKEEKAAKARKGELKERFFEAIERQGYEDDKGHAYLDLPEEIEGYSKVKRELRVSQSLDEEATEELLREKGLWDACTKTVRVIDEEAVAKAVFEGKIKRSEYDAMIARKETFAFVPCR